MLEMIDAQTNSQRHVGGMIMSVRPLLDEVERLRGIIRECFEDDCWYEQEPDDQTRGWCSDLSMYLRGNAACIVQVTPEMLAEIRKIVG